MSKTGLTIINTGSPAKPTAESVRAYLQEFLTDPYIRPMPSFAWNLILKAFILPRRSEASAGKYASIWTDQGSPLSANMASLCAKVNHACGEDIVVRCAMSYGIPSIDDALLELRDAGCDELVVIPLYPQSAFSTTTAVRDRLEHALDMMSWRPVVRFVDHYWDKAGYLDAIASSIERSGFRTGDKLLIAFHSIPMKDVNAGDTYPEQTSRTARAVAQRLGLDDDRWTIGYQSRFDKNRKWLGPFTSQVLDALDAKSNRLFVVAPNFSMDCLETLYDIEASMRTSVLASGQARSFHYVACLNDSDEHVKLISSIVRDETKRHS